MSNGGPAFPQFTGQPGHYSGMGMTLRDYFAAAALKSGQCPCNSYDGDEMAGWAFGVADAMLKEREPQPQGSIKENT